MRIVERIKDAVEHTADSWQQKLLNEYNASDEPAARARKIISELVKQLEKPNQVIINDIVSLIYALASNPDASIDLEQVVSTAQMLIHELVEPIPNPDKRLMDELLHIVVTATSHKGGASGANRSQQNAPMTSNQSSSVSNMQSQPTKTASQSTSTAPSQNQTPAANASAPQSTTSGQSQAQQQTQSQPSNPAPAPAATGKVDNSMIKLIMDEMKEVIKKNQLTEQRITDVENRMAARISTFGDDMQGMKDNIKKQGADLETINKNLDKFISLYEVVINQYNPFIEHIDEPKPKGPAQTPLQVQQTASAAKKEETNTSAAAKAAAVTSATQANAESSEGDIHVLIDKVKDMTDDAFAKSKEKTAKWITTVLKDDELAEAFGQATTKAQAVKLLLSKSLA